MRQYVVKSDSLMRKGVDYVIDVNPEESLVFNTLDEIYANVRRLSKLIGFDREHVFQGNEAIGSDYMLFKYHVQINGFYVSVRVVTKGRSIVRVLYTIPKGVSLSLRAEPSRYNVDEELTVKEGKGVRGQVWIPYPVVYAILGVPDVKANEWLLNVKGLVEKEVSLRLPDLYELGVVEINVDFHCVTGWSTKLTFTGVGLSKLIDLAKPVEGVKWVYIECLDSYTTVFPYSEVSNAIVALEMNGKPLAIEHGYPARLVVPTLFGWKSAKWVKNVVLMDSYVDGFWEALGYHPRGKVEFDERFKEV